MTNPHAPAVDPPRLSFLAELPRAFAYPFRGRGQYILFFGAGGLAVASLLGGIIGWGGMLLSMLMTCYVGMYLLSIIGDSAGGTPIRALKRLIRPGIIFIRRIPSDVQWALVRESNVRPSGCLAHLSIELRPMELGQVPIRDVPQKLPKSLGAIARQADTFSTILSCWPGRWRNPPPETDE